jgi:hypothetical protein
MKEAAAEMAAAPPGRRDILARMKDTVAEIAGLEAVLPVVTITWGRGTETTLYGLIASAGFPRLTNPTTPTGPVDWIPGLMGRVAGYLTCRLSTQTTFL